MTRDDYVMGKIMIEPGILLELMDFGVLEFFFPLFSDKPCMPESLKSSSIFALGIGGVLATTDCSLAAGSMPTALRKPRCWQRKWPEPLGSCPCQTGNHLP